MRGMQVGLRMLSMRESEAMLKFFFYFFKNIYIYTIYSFIYAYIYIYICAYIYIYSLSLIPCVPAIILLSYLLACIFYYLDFFLSLTPDFSSLFCLSQAINLGTVLKIKSDKDAAIMLSL